MKEKIWNKNIVIVASVYFVQGIVVIASLAEFLLTKNVYKFSWIELALLSSFSVLTWSIKPIFGFLTDLLPFFGSRRRNYLLLSSLLSVFGYLFLAFFGTSFAFIALALAIANIGLSFSDVIADGIVVESSNEKNVGIYQAICWRSKAFGIFIGYLLSGFLIQNQIFLNLLKGTFLSNFLKSNLKAFYDISETLGFNITDIRFTFIITGLLSLIVFFLVLALFKEKGIEEKKLDLIRKKIPVFYLYSALGAFLLTAGIVIFLSANTESIFSFIKNDTLSSLLVIIIWISWISLYMSHLLKEKFATSTLIYSAVFLFLWRFTPSFGAPWSDYFLNQLKVNPANLGFVNTLTPLAWILGSFIYVRFIDQIPIKKVLLWTVIFGSIFSLSQLPVASPDVGSLIGSNFLVKNFSAVLLFPAFFFGYGFEAWNQISMQNPVLNFYAFSNFFLEILFIISFLPLFKLAAMVTPKGVEATNFSILASIMNLGLAFGLISGGIIYTKIEGSYNFMNFNFTGLYLTIIIGSLASLACLLVLGKIDPKKIKVKK